MAGVFPSRWMRRPVRMSAAVAADGPAAAVASVFVPVPVVKAVAAAGRLAAPGAAAARWRGCRCADCGRSRLWCRRKPGGGGCGCPVMCRFRQYRCRRCWHVRHRCHGHCQHWCHRCHRPCRLCRPEPWDRWSWRYPAGCLCGRLPAAQGQRRPIPGCCPLVCPRAVRRLTQKGRSPPHRQSER